MTHYYIINKVKGLVKGILPLCLLTFLPLYASAQNKIVNPDISYAGTPRQCEIGGITVEGVEGYEDFVLINLSQLRVGQSIEVPGSEITEAVKRYWKHGLFSDVSITADSIVDSKVYLCIHLSLRPRITNIEYHGVKKSEREDLENKLKLANNKFQTSRLWNCYTIVNPQSVKKHSTKEEKEALTNIIQLVRFANHQIETLESLYPSAQQRFNLWYGQVQRTVTESQITIIRQIVDYIASNGACTIKDIIDDDKTRAAQLIKAFGGKSQADEALVSLSKFLLYRKTA